MNMDMNAKEKMSYVIYDSIPTGTDERHARGYTRSAPAESIPQAGIEIKILTSYFQKFLLKLANKH